MRRAVRAWPPRHRPGASGFRRRGTPVSSLSRWKQATKSARTIDLKSETHDEITSFSGAGLKDITRIAGGEPVMWRDICIAYKDSILHCLDRFQETLNHLRSDIEQENGELLTQEFERANKHRLNLIGNA